MRGGRKTDEKFCNIIRRKKPIKTNASKIKVSQIQQALRLQLSQSCQILFLFLYIN